MKHYFYADEKGFVTCHSPQAMIEIKYKEIEILTPDGEKVKVQEPYEVLADGWVEVEDPTEDMLENMLWYKCVNGELIKMEEEKVRELYPGLFPDLQPEPEPSFEEQQTDFNLDVDYRISCIELGLI